MRTTLAALVTLGLLASLSFAEDDAKSQKASPKASETPYGAPNPAWLSPAVLASGVDVPWLRGVAADDALLAEGEPGWLVVTVDGRGLVRLRGKFFDLSSEDPGIQDDAIRTFRDEVRKAVPADADRSPDGTARLRALVFPDRAAKWKYVQWIMQAFADPSVRIHRISFAIRRAETAGSEPIAKKGEPSRYGRLDVTLPVDGPTTLESPPQIRLKVFRRELREPAKAYTLIKVDQDAQTWALPRGWRGHLREPPERVARYAAVIKGLRTRLDRSIHARGQGAKGPRVEIVAPPPKGGAVPYGDVAHLVLLAHDLGVTDVVFEGASTPLTVRERVQRDAKRKPR